MRHLLTIARLSILTIAAVSNVGWADEAELPALVPAVVESTPVGGEALPTELSRPAKTVKPVMPDSRTR